jgi:hypothetical protein
MIAMSMITTCDEHHHDRHISIPADPAAPTHSMRHAVLRVLSMIGFGIGGIATVDDADAFVH